VTVHGRPLLCTLLLLAAGAVPANAVIGQQNKQPVRRDAYRLSEVVIRLERTECGGPPCPIYRVAISGDGAVEYEGLRSVESVGIRKSTITVDQVVSLLNEFLRVRFFDLLDRYAGTERVRRSTSGLLLEYITVSDERSATLTLQLGEQIKRVGLYDNYPAELGNLPGLIDRIVSSEQWIGKTK
jgi:hypothetical protein